MKKKRQGFTLVELLAVIVILAIILAITIPAVLEATNAAKKESFFLYAQSLQSKAIAQYTQDLEHNKELTDCAVYNIDEDLHLSDTGKYQGWIQVKRTPVSSGKKQVYVELSDTRGLEYVKYCVAKGNSCTPTDPYAVLDNTTSATISKTVADGYVLCANYEYEEGGTLKKGSTKCMTYANGNDINDTYDYQVTLSLIDDSYAASVVPFNKDMSMEAFYSYMDTGKNKAGGAISIVEPICSASGTAQVITRGQKNTETTLVTLEGDKILGTTIVSVPGDKTTSVHYVTTNATKGTTIQNVTSTTTDKIANTSKVTSTTTDKTANKTNVTSSSKKTTTDQVVGTTTKTTQNTKVTSTTTDRTANKTTVTSSSKKTTTDQVVGTTTKTTQNTKVTSTTTDRTANKTTVTTTGKKTTTDIVVGTTTTTTTNKIVGTTTTTTTDQVVTTLVTTTRRTTYLETTTVDPKDTSLQLAELSVKGYDIGFTPLKYYYDLDVPYGTEFVEVEVKGTTEDTVITVSGASNITVGANPVIVQLYNTKTGDRSFYRIYVYETEKPGSNISTTTKDPYEWDPESGVPDPTLDESDASLTLLSVAGYNLKFNPNVYDYTLETMGDKELKIYTRTASKGAIVNINGNENLEDGSQIVIMVQSQNGYYHKTYTINVKVKDTTSTTTKVLQGVAAGLGVTAAAVGIAVHLIKKRKVAVVQEDEQVTPSNTDNRSVDNNNQGK